MGFFGSSGIRRIFDRELLELTFEVGLSLGERYNSVVVASDTRTTGDALKHALISGLLSRGCQAWDAGVLPTPSLAYAARNFEAGVIITASHNPPEYNGIKLFNSDGSAFDFTQRAAIEEKIGKGHLKAAPWDRAQSYKTYGNAVVEHVGRILQDFKTIPRLKVVVDCGGGAASIASPYLLQRLGCDALALNSHPTGFFPRGIEPTSENLGELVRVVKAVGAHLGLAHDGDADRMVVVDETGKLIPGDIILALFAREIGARKIITTVDASMSLDELGFEVVRTRVGDAFVSEELKKGGEFGGEPSGAWIFPKVSFCPDGIYAAALIVRIAARERLSSLIENVPRYSVIRGSIDGEKDIIEPLKEELMTLKPLSASTADGLRLVFEDGWLLVRASGTEPKIRITAEARDAQRAKKLYNTAISFVQECLKKQRGEVK